MRSPFHQAILITARGGPERLEASELPTPAPRAREVLVRVAAAGVNFMDIGVRTGQLWRDAPLPLVPGVEGAGDVVAIGSDVTSLKVGDRVAWVYVQGSYSKMLIAPEAALVPIPDWMSHQVAASIMMQGVTASHFANEFYPVQRGDVTLVHAAAGGVGQLLTQIIKSRGGTVIGRVSHDDKIDPAKAAGADQVIVDANGSFAAQVKDLTGGQGVHAVFDGSGGATFADSLASLRRHGTLAYYGPVLGSPPPIDIATLPRSIKLGFPTFNDHIPDRASLLAVTARLFAQVEAGEIKAPPVTPYPLPQAQRAHLDLQSRRSVGKLLLIPDAEG
jgi:NADPH2:quinone reductase